jgi:hypothetical protein
MTAKNYQLFWANMPANKDEVAEALEAVISQFHEKEDFVGLLEKFSQTEDFTLLFRSFSDVATKELEQIAEALIKYQPKSRH